MRRSYRLAIVALLAMLIAAIFAFPGSALAADAASPSEIRPTSGLTLTSSPSGGYAVKLASTSDSFETACTDAKVAFEQSQYAIIANVDDWADVLSASSLAGVLDCPILYTNADSIPRVTTDTLSSLDVSRIIIIGGDSVVSEDVADTLRGTFGKYNVTRISGADRYETQMAIYDYGAKTDSWESGLAIVASGQNYADALSIASVAYSQKAPIFLVDETGSLPDAQAQALLADETLSSAAIVGGTSAVSDETEGFLELITVKNAGEQDVTRLVGSDSSQTGAAVAEWAVDEGYATFDDADVVSLAAPAIALSTSIANAHDGGVLILADANDTDVPAALVGADIRCLTFVGSPDIFPPSLRTNWALELGFKLSDVQGCVLYPDAEHAETGDSSVPVVLREADGE